MASLAIGRKILSKSLGRARAATKRSDSFIMLPSCVRVLLVAMACAIAASHSAVAKNPAAELKAAVDPIVAAMAKKYSCAVSVALQTPGASGPGDTAPGIAVASASGVVDRSSGRLAELSDVYVWGSVTKVVTGTGILRLVDRKKISLEDPVPQYVDPFLKRTAASDPSQNFTSLEELWGPEVYKITVKDLLGMKSGVPDYDTASPSGREPTDVFRADSYAHPSRSFSPTQLLNLPWVRTGKLQFPPGKCDQKKYFNCYSSTNYVLLGMILANHAHAAGWQSYNQTDILADVMSDFSSLRFATAGPPSAYSPVHGYDTTHYNNNTRAIDVSNVSGVFGGWTAADLVADATEVVALVQDVYGPRHKLVSKSLANQMYSESAQTGYGLSTFNLTRLTPKDVAYGHLGATYGYQSVVVFAPGLNLSLAIATNIERDYQDQPADVFCSVYNTAKSILLGRRVPTCTFSPGYWTGGCKCDDEVPSVIV